MDDREHIETQLRQYRHDGKARTRSAVIDAFERQQRGGTRPRGNRRLWSRTVPGYLVIGMVAVAAVLAFTVGRYTAAGPGHLAGREVAPEDGGLADTGITWSIAVRDQL